MKSKVKLILSKLTGGSSLLNGMLIYSIGSFGSRIINFAIYPLLTFYLLKPELGYYDLVINTIYLIIPLATLQIGDGIYRGTLPLSRIEDVKSVISSGLFIFVITIFPLLFIIYFVISSLYEIEYGALILLMSFLYSLNITLKQITRGLRENRVYVTSDILYSFFFVSMIVVLMTTYNEKLQGVFISFIVTNLISILYILFKSKIVKRVDLRRVNMTMSKKLLNYSLPLIPNSISWWLVGSVNTYIVLTLLGLSSNGIYAIAFKFSSIIYLMNKVFSLAWQDYVIMDNEKDENYKSKVINNLLFFLTFIIFVIILLIRPIINIIVSSDYYEAWEYVPFLLIASLFSSLSTFYGAYYLKWSSTNKIFITTLWGAFTTIISSYFLTLSFGLLGTSISMMLGFMVVAFMRWYDTRLILNIKFKPKLLFMLLLIAVSITLNYII